MEDVKQLIVIPTPDIAAYNVLVATTTGNGASRIGIEDSSGNYTSDTVEGALAEVGRGKITRVTTTYQILDTDKTVVCDSVTPFTVTLPIATVGKQFKIKNVNTGAVTVEGYSTDIIDGELNQNVNEWECLEVECYFNNKWGIM